MKVSSSLFCALLAAQSSAIALPSELSPLGEADAAGSALQVRQGARVQLAQGAFLAAGQFAYNAAGKCPTLAKEEDVNKAQCGISASFAVISAAFGSIELAAAYRQRAQQQSSKRGVIDSSHFERVWSWKDELMPQNDDSLIDGLTISITPYMSTFDEDGERWNHYDYEGYSAEHNTTNYAQIRVQPSNNRTIVSSMVNDDSTKGSLNKRAVVYAHYSYVDGNTQNYNRGSLTSSDVHRLAASAWNFLHNNNIDRSCASPYDVLNPGRAYIERAEFALSTGTYKDESSSCPEPRS